MPDARAARRLNRAHWDALAAVHGHDAYYDEDALVAGADSLSELEAAGIREAVGAVAGLDVVHIQCPGGLRPSSPGASRPVYPGRDTISLARRGARVTGLCCSRVATDAPRGDVLAREQDGRYRLRLGGEALPLSYTLIARRP
jgi:hypothetical protein